MCEIPPARTAIAARILLTTAKGNSPSQSEEMVTP